MRRKIIDNIQAKYDQDPDNPQRYVGVVFFERPHPQLASRQNQYVLRTGIRHSEAEIRAWCRTNLDAVTPAEVNALLDQPNELSVVPSESVQARPHPQLTGPKQ